MNRSLLLGIMIFFVVVGISLVGGDQPQAQAGWGHHGWYGWGGWYGGYYGTYAPVYVHRPLYHHHWRHRWVGYGCYGCYGCLGYVGCGCYGYSYCGGCYGYLGCAGYTDCCGCAGVMVDPAVPSEPQMAPQEESSAPSLPPQPEPASTDSAHLNLQVPADAKVIINDHVTTSTGEARQYVSRGLQPGMKYRFEVRAEVVRNGATQSRTKVVELQANGSAELTFDLEAPQVAGLER
jgi:uncharacterized protein (TIGR03000 family)